MDKHCPHCRHLLHVEMGQKTGACDRCTKDYVVHYHLTKIRLNKIFVPRDYEAEILAFVAKKEKTYAGEISYRVHASKGVVAGTLKSLESQGLIEVVPRGKTKWIFLPGRGGKIR